MTSIHYGPTGHRVLRPAPLADDYDDVPIKAIPAHNVATITAIEAQLRSCGARQRETARCDIVGRLVLAFEQAVTSGSKEAVTEALGAMEAAGMAQLAKSKRRELT